MPVEELAEFLGVNRTEHEPPPVLSRKFKMKLKKGHPFDAEVVCHVYEYEDSCIRCDQRSQKTDLLCGKCTEYLKESM